MHLTENRASMLLWQLTAGCTVILVSPFLSDGFSVYTTMFTLVCSLTRLFWKVLHIIQLPSFSACLPVSYLNTSIWFVMPHFHILSNDQPNPQINFSFNFSHQSSYCICHWFIYTVNPQQQMSVSLCVFQSDQQSVVLWLFQMDTILILQCIPDGRWNVLLMYYFRTKCQLFLHVEQWK